MNQLLKGELGFLVFFFPLAWDAVRSSRSLFRRRLESGTGPLMFDQVFSEPDGRRELCDEYTEVLLSPTRETTGKCTETKLELGFVA